MADKTETVNFPVTQSINPWVFNIGVNGLGTGGGTAGTVAMGTSRDERLERTILDAAGSYGRQIGRIGEALEALLARFERLDAAKAEPFTGDEERAIKEFRAQLDVVKQIKHFRR